MHYVLGLLNVYHHIAIDPGYIIYTVVFVFFLLRCVGYIAKFWNYIFSGFFFLSVTGTHTLSKNQQNINLNLHLGPQNCWRIFSWHDVWHWICTVTWFLLLFFLPFLLIYFPLLLLLLQLFQDVFDPFWKFLWKMSFSTNTHNFFLECWVTTCVAQWIMEALKFLSSYLGNCVNYTSAIFFHM